MALTKDEALAIIMHNNNTIKSIEEQNAEMRKVIDAPEVDPRKGKLFEFYDENSSYKELGYFEEEVTDSRYFYYDKNGVGWERCRPVTRAELEGKFLEDVTPIPKVKKTRYDWSQAPAEAMYWATDETGQQDVFVKEPEASEYAGAHGKGGWTLYTIGRCRNMAPPTDEGCADWRDSCEKRPE